MNIFIDVLTYTVLNRFIRPPFIKTRKHKYFKNLNKLKMIEFIAKFGPAHWTCPRSQKLMKHSIQPLKEFCCSGMQVSECNLASLLLIMFFTFLFFVKM